LQKLIVGAMTSFTEENYLKIIYGLSKDTSSGVSTNALAEQTQTKAASVSDMLRKLAEKKWVHYQKYQGVRLTDEGQRLALRVIRKHRLWEVFLVEKLGFGWDEVHQIAEEMEHIESEELVERLDHFLGHPRFDPHGDPIPDPKGFMPTFAYQNLAEIPLQTPVKMMGVSEHSTAFLQYLAKVGLHLGVNMCILEVNDFDQSLQISIGQAPPQFVSHEVARHVLVKPA
jgi:DtxR family transcriptional regulator, Mn-dependent transcriptional regulator